MVLIHVKGFVFKFLSLFLYIAKKKLLTPQPRLRTGFFCELEASTLPEGVLAEACTALGVAKYGKPLGLDAELKVDLIVIGSVAVDPKTGARLGKGEASTLIFHVIPGSGAQLLENGNAKKM